MSSQTEYSMYFLHEGMCHIWNARYGSIGIILLSFAFWLSLYLITKYVNNLIFKNKTYYESLSLQRRVFWDASIVRAFFGIIGTFVGVHVTMINDYFMRDIVSNTNQTGLFVICVATGFFLFECVLVTYADLSTFFDPNSKFQFQKAIHLHHWTMLICYMNGVYYYQGFFIALFGLILEISTPFSALSWIGLQLKLVDTLPWFINQCILIHTFHIRSICEMIMLFKIYQCSDHSATIMHPWPRFFNTMSLLSLAFFLTPYWGYKKTQQLFLKKDFLHKSQ